jgi:hypothetical protein
VIYDFVEKPTYKPANEIPQDEIKSELNRILNLLSRKGDSKISIKCLNLKIKTQCN